MGSRKERGQLDWIRNQVFRMADCLTRTVLVALAGFMS